MAISGGLFDTIGGASDAIFGAIGSFQAAGGYKASAKASLTAAGYANQAADLSTTNAAISEASTRIQAAQSAREIYQGIGGQAADVSGAGFAASGSALDLLRSSTQQGALQSQLIQEQGAISKSGYLGQALGEKAQAVSYEGQAAAYAAQASASKTSGIGGIFKAVLGIGSLFLSDENAKMDFRLLGPSHIDGINLYLFRYQGDPTIFQGVKAQEVERVRPDAVSYGEGGLLSVDYAKLGIEMKEVA